jgi:hypothetical protein
MHWAKSNDSEFTQQDDQSEQTETIYTHTPAFPVNSFTWQHAILHTTNTPHGVLYETVAEPIGDMTPSREWIFCKPANAKQIATWQFTLGRSQGLQPRSKLPWGPPSAELTDVTKYVKCATCGRHPSKVSVCKHTKLQVQPQDMPVQVPSKLPVEIGTQSLIQQGAQNV